MNLTCKRLKEAFHLILNTTLKFVFEKNHVFKWIAYKSRFEESNFENELHTVESFKK